MNILFIAPMPPPVTGQSLAVKILYDDLIKRHGVDIVDLTKDSFENGVISCSRILQVLRICKKVWIRKKNADVIYFTISESIAGNIKDLIIYLICYKNLHNVIIHLHGGSLKKLLFDKYLILFSVNKYFIRRLGGVIVLGQSHIGIFSDIINLNKIHVISNFAEDYMFASEEEVKEKFVTIYPINILFMSNLILGKGFNDLVDAFIILDSVYKEKVSIDFAGAFDSDLQKEAFLKKINRKSGIKYHGIVQGFAKKNLFNKAHVFCLPTSLFEGQPISILEAYASGCFVITTDSGGIRDIFVDGENGLEVQVNSVKSLKSAIEHVVDTHTNLLPIALHNRKIAHKKYRTSNYNSNLSNILETIGL